MKRILSLLMTAMILSAVMIPSALAADTSSACYPSSVTRSEDGREIRKVYDLGPEEDPAGIPRSDFQQDGVRYTLVDLFKQELPENESRQHVETVTLESKNKDMASVLELLPQQREFVTDDGLSGTLTLQLDTVQVDVSGYGSSTKAVNVTRSYPNLAGQDTSYIPKTIQDSGRTLTLQDISWQTDNTASLDGYAVGDRFTAVATYSGSATSSYVKGYTVTANYSGTVSRIALNKTRYVAIFEGDAPTVDIIPTEADSGSDSGFRFNWAYLLVPLGVIALAGGGMGTALYLKRRHESEEGTE
ncbi:cell wall anchor protein [uncultured Oscillibacter sp.]|uniref:cell wall anchor protein n=1 Tax=uncultured Oscillibacter sp. TaxID=876091 RepID=UPI0026275569|nr:cell wall anchor protein [uncultured Oscillibacter sp.]